MHPPGSGGFAAIVSRLLPRLLISIVGLSLILVGTLAAFGLPVGPSLQLVMQGAFGDAYAWSRTAVKATPLIFTGLGMVIAWRAGMYNIGGEGQFLMGALLGSVFAKIALANIGAPAAAITVAILLLSAVGGAVWGWVAAWLYAKRGVEVVISTILLNFIAIQILSYAVGGPLKEAKGQLPLTDMLPQALMLPRFDRRMDVHGGLFIALLMVSVVFIYLYQTRAGFNVRLAGESMRVARANRIDGMGMKIQAMMISGALCGLAGGIEYTGVSGQLGGGFSQQWGFLGIPVALLASLYPLLVLPSALFFGALFAGSENLARYTPAGPTLIYVIQGVAVLGFVALRSFEGRKQIQKDK